MKQKFAKLRRAKVYKHKENTPERRRSILECLEKASHQALSRQDIVEAFRRTGIHPWDITPILAGPLVSEERIAPRSRLNRQRHSINGMVLTTDAYVQAAKERQIQAEEKKVKKGKRKKEKEKRKSMPRKENERGQGAKRRQRKDEDSFIVSEGERSPPKKKARKEGARKVETPNPEELRALGIIQSFKFTIDDGF